MKLSAEQIKIMHHSLGLDRAEKSYRNYFCAEPGHDDMPIIKQLVALWMMWESHKINEGRDTIFKVSISGLKSLDLDGEIVDVYGKPREVAQSILDALDA